MISTILFTTVGFVWTISHLWSHSIHLTVTW